MPNSVLFIDVMPSLVALGCITKIPLEKQLLPKSHQIPRPFKISLNGRTEIECVNWMCLLNKRLDIKTL